MTFPWPIHPDMRELLAAKETFAKLSDAGAQRAGWNNYANALQREYPAGMTVLDTEFPCDVADGPRNIPVRIYRPEAVTAQSPCVVYLHGGAFIKGSLESGDPISWGIADHVGCVVVSVDYRLAPEHPFPAGVEDCYAAISYIAAHGRELEIDARNIAVWGDSAGGNMAAACCLMARDRKGPPIAAQVLIYPCLTDELTAASYRTYADAPVTTASIDRAWSLYLGDRRPTRDPYAAPLKATDFSHLPPAHIHEAQIDCLADDSVQYAERLRAAGNPLVFRRAQDMIHGFVRARFTGPGARSEFDAPCGFLRGIFANRTREPRRTDETADRGGEVDVSRSPSRAGP
ncbi:acetyl esterase [Rhodoligotrophos appendicifer]|uniref:alpha/beta hydrolase n=1 Tax=Rhodoligotrophos appendicifer TaxID=987056 RepID=UPI0011857F19|nr:alpha/beta hydrolase [Rhodoligotrophos appendicifer]